MGEREGEMEGERDGGRGRERERERETVGPISHVHVVCTFDLLCCPEEVGQFICDLHNFSFLLHTHQSLPVGWGREEMRKGGGTLICVGSNRPAKPGDRHTEVKITVLCIT